MKKQLEGFDTRRNVEIVSRCTGKFIIEILNICLELTFQQRLENFNLFDRKLLVG